MGLGGYLTWTAAAREIVKKVGSEVKCMPVEKHGHFLKPIDSPVFKNNSDFLSPADLEKNNTYVFPLVLNNPDANYCKKDTPQKAFHRTDSHIIEQVCEVYGISNPDLRCYLSLAREDMTFAKKMIKNSLGQKKFVTIEPVSKINYTHNRAYPYEKWQLVVDKLSEKIINLNKRNLSVRSGNINFVPIF